MGFQTKQDREERGQPSNVAGGEEDQPATFAHPAIYLRIAPVKKIFRARDIGTGPRPISSSTNRKRRLRRSRMPYRGFGVGHRCVNLDLDVSERKLSWAGVTRQAHLFWGLS